MLSAPAIILSRQLRVEGESTRHLERGALLGDFVRIRPGAFLPAAEWDALDARSRHLVAMAAVAKTSRRRLLFSGESAAALHGIPLLGGWTARPHIVDHVERRRAALVDVVTHRFELREHEVVQVQDVLATSPLRTAFDIAAQRGFLAGVVAVDHVLGRSFAVDRSAAAAWLDGARGRRGYRRMATALAVATGLAESPLESLSLGQCHLLGFPAPRQQVEFVVDGHRYRADFHFEEADVIGEADGRSKYGPDAGSPPRGEDRLWAEKEREDSLRSIVRGFARWEWNHALHGEGLRVRLERAGVQRVR
jgi:hypothetical protein